MWSPPVAFNTNNKLRTKGRLPLESSISVDEKQERLGAEVRSASEGSDSAGSIDYAFENASVTVGYCNEKRHV